jgi:riboflavin kinase/FMN adenylyltransferase
MQVHEGFEHLAPLPFAVVTSGTFDGVHIGHRKILSRLNEIAARNNGQSVVLTYWPHPRLVLYPEQTDLKLLNTFEEKAELLESLGIDHLIKIPFTKSFSQLSGDTFTRRVLMEKIGTKKLVIGYDHRFGKNREGSFEYLKENAHHYGFEVEEIPPQDIDDVTVSSTKIRKALMAGHVDEAASFLGDYYHLSGTVIHGDKIGRSLGFPTANIYVEHKFKLIPAEGIYAVTIDIDKQEFKGMLYIGKRPTLNKVEQNIEVNIFDFNRDIYGEPLKINFIRQIRSEMKFDNLDQLKEQLRLDRIKASKVLNL